MLRFLISGARTHTTTIVLGRPDQKGSTGRDNRMFVEGVLWIVRTGSPWRDLPAAFGEWNSVFRRFSRWSLKGDGRSNKKQAQGGRWGLEASGSSEISRKYHSTPRASQNAASIGLRIWRYSNRIGAAYSMVRGQV